MVCRCVLSRNVKNEAALARVGLLHQGKEKVYMRMSLNVTEIFKRPFKERKVTTNRPNPPPEGQVEIKVH